MILFILYKIFSYQEKVSCVFKVDNEIHLEVFAKIQDIGISDVIYHRDIFLIKNEDTLQVDLGPSERIGFYVKLDTLSMSGHIINIIIIQNIDDPIYEIINIDKMSVLDKNFFLTKIGDIHTLVSSSTLLDGCYDN